MSMTDPDDPEFDQPMQPLLGLAGSAIVHIVILGCTTQQEWQILEEQRPELEAC